MYETICNDDCNAQNVIGPISKVICNCCLYNLYRHINAIINTINAYNDINVSRMHAKLKLIHAYCISI